MNDKLERLARFAVAAPLGAAFAWIGVEHFIEPQKFDDIVPPYLGWPRFWTLASGVFEVVLGLGLIVPATRARSARWLVCLVILMSLANINMWWNDVAFNGTRLGPTGHLIRFTIQLALLVTLWWLGRRVSSPSASDAR